MSSLTFKWQVLAFRLLVPHSRVIKVVVCIGLEDTADGVTDLLDLGLEPAVVAMVRVLDMLVQARDPVHILFMAEYIRALIT